VKPSLDILLFISGLGRERVVDVGAGPALFLESIEQPGLVRGRLSEFLYQRIPEPQPAALRVPVGQTEGRRLCLDWRSVRVFT
jgi:hypothetical protein